MYNVYILKSSKYRKTYVGYSNDINRRLKEHNSGKVSYTKKYKPWKIICLETYKSLTEARQRERYLKSGAGRRWMKNLFSK
jgi:putative endonuclease